MKQMQWWVAEGAVKEVAKALEDPDADTAAETAVQDLAPGGSTARKNGASTARPEKNGAAVPAENSNAASAQDALSSVSGAAMLGTALGGDNRGSALAEDERSTPSARDKPSSASAGDRIDAAASPGGGDQRSPEVSPTNSVDRGWEEGGDQDSSWDGGQPPKGDPLGVARVRSPFH
jgi:hypothetical protein